MICPKCGASGAIVTRSVVPDRDMDIYCNSCGRESQIPNHLQRKYMEPMEKKKEAVKVLKVSYNGFTGELVKLEKKSVYSHHNMVQTLYALDIFDAEKKVTHSFAGVKLEDIRFFGGAVVFC